MLSILFPVRLSKIGRVGHESLLLHRIRNNELQLVKHIPEEWAGNTKQWRGGKWRKTSEEIANKKKSEK